MFKRLLCAIFCNKPLELIYYEELEDIHFRKVKCPKCGLEYAVVNKK